MCRYGPSKWSFLIYNIILGSNISTMEKFPILCLVDKLLQVFFFLIMKGFVVISPITCCFESVLVRLWRYCCLLCCVRSKKNVWGHFLLWQCKLPPVRANANQTQLTSISVNLPTCRATNWERTDWCRVQTTWRLDKEESFIDDQLSLIHYWGPTCPNR